MTTFHKLVSWELKVVAAHVKSLTILSSVERHLQIPLSVRLSVHSSFVVAGATNFTPHFLPYILIHTLGSGTPAAALSRTNHVVLINLCSAFHPSFFCIFLFYFVSFFSTQSGNKVQNSQLLNYVFYYPEFPSWKQPGGRVWRKKCL